MAIQQASGSIHVQLVGLLKYSGQSDNTATQRIYNKSNVQCTLINQLVVHEYYLRPAELPHRYFDYEDYKVDESPLFNFQLKWPLEKLPLDR